MGKENHTQLEVERPRVLLQSVIFTRTTHQIPTVEVRLFVDRKTNLYPVEFSTVMLNQSGEPFPAGNMVVTTDSGTRQKAGSEFIVLRDIYFGLDTQQMKLYVKVSKQETYEFYIDFPRR